MAAGRRARARVARISAVSLSAATLLLAALHQARDRAIALPVPAPTTTPLAVMVDKDGFHPSSLHLTPGQTVTWTNGDKIQHTATAADGTWDTGPIDPGRSVSLQFTELGKWDYMCGFKPALRAAIIVGAPTPAPRTPSPQPTQAPTIVAATPAPASPATTAPVSATPAPADTPTPEPAGGAPQPMTIPGA